MGYISGITASPPAILAAAYGAQPMHYRVVAVDCPVVYCDIYMNGVYYRTLSSTVPANPTGPNNTGGFDFDLRGVCQEYLASDTPEWWQPFVLPAPRVTATYQVRFRASTKNADGTITQQGPIPIQATWNTAAVPGGGYAHNVYLVGNMATQHGYGLDAEAYMWWKYPNPIDYRWKLHLATNRPEGSWKVTRDEMLTLPLYVGNTLPFGGNPSPGFHYFRFFVLTDNGAEYWLHRPDLPPIQQLPQQFRFDQGKCYYLPLAPRSIAQWAQEINAPVPPFASMRRYRIGLGRYVAGQQDYARHWVSPWVEVENPCPGSRKLHFLNSLGMYDWVRFHEASEATITTSTQWQRRFGSLPYGIQDKRQSSAERFGVRSAERETVTGIFQEKEQEWLKELLETPSLYFEDGPLDVGTFGRFDVGENTSFTPAVMLDGEFQTRKRDDRYEYEMTVAFARSSARQTLRN